MSLNPRPAANSAALVLTAVALVAGCGSSGSNFKSDFKKQEPSLTALGHAIGAAVQGAGSKTNAELASSFTALADQASNAVNKLNGLTPTSNATSDFDTLKSAVTKVEADLKSISSAAQAGNITIAKQASATLSVDGQQAKTSIDAVKKDIGS